MNEEAERWRERFNAAVEDAQAQRDIVHEYESAISWNTSCLNCASLLDSSYDNYVRAERAEAALKDVLDRHVNRLIEEQE